MSAGMRMRQRNSISGMLAGFAASLLLLGPADAQQIPPPEEGEATIRVTRTGNQFELADAANNYVILGRGYPFFESMGPGIEVSVDFRTQPTGADIVYTLVNTGAAPAQMGKFSFGKLNLGNNITYQNFAHIGEPIVVDYNNYVHQGFFYPSSTYSPVWVVRNADYAVGFSLQYPILDYKHDVRVTLGSSPADADPAVYGPRGWAVEYRFGNLGDETPEGINRLPSMLAPGEQRTYVVSVRVTKNPTEWVRTLVPYRNYFKSMYGGVSYRRDPRPIRPILMAVEHNIAPGNPYGWAGYPSQRPDQYTFRPWVDAIKGETKWARTMVWGPTGLYNERTELNFPFQFTSRWVDDQRLASALDPENGFPSVAQSGMTLGLWWGRSVQVARTWNPEVMENFDPANRDHREAAFREMDIAVQAGATDIGLDTFAPTVSPIWNLYPWIRTLRERYPSVKFCIEPLSCDIMHTQAAMFVLAWHPSMPPDAGPDWNWLQTPFYLADFLNPGHESWGAMSYHVHHYYHIPITPEQVQRDTGRIAAKGFVPVMFDDVPHPQEFFAADSWTTSVPADLQRGSGWNTNFTPNMVVRGADGKLSIVAGSGPAKPGQEHAPGEDANHGATPSDAAPVVPETGDGSDAPPADSGAASRSPGKSTKSSAAKSKAGAKPQKPKPTQQAATGSAAPARRPASTGRAGTAVSSAALARAGLLGKSSGTFNRNQILHALQRMNENAGGDGK